jgi:Na+/H+-dicarboxylate symporter
MYNVELADNVIRPFGTLFLNLLKFIVVPIVLLSITAGVISMKDIRKVGSIGWKTIVYYLCTTAVAVVIGLVAANVFKGAFPALSVSGLEYTPAEAPSALAVLIDIFPSNPVAPLVSANMLQIIVIALLVGVGIILAGSKGEAVANLVESANEVFMLIMTFIIKLSPFGVFCLIVPVVAANGPAILGSLAMVLLAAYICYVLHAVVVYSSTLKIMAGMNPFTFFKGMAPAMIMAFSSASSVGTLPLNMECAEKLGAKKDIASFVLPLGATINMDGTAIYQGLCSVFIASCFGIQLTLSQMAMIVLTATLASIGTAGVPGAGMIMLAMVLQSVGLPVEGIALVAGVDRIFDMGRTTINITGDAACAIIVTKLEEKKEKRQLAANR